MEKDELFLRFRDERDNPEARHNMRRLIEQQTAEYLANGGEIESVAPGAGKNSPVPITKARLWEINS